MGPGVTVRARYSNLLREIEEIATLAGIGFAAARLTDGAIAFGLRAPRDRTAATPAPVVFSPQLGTVQTLAYTEAALRSRNAVYVLGSGAGATRLVQLVTDDADIAAHGRREFSFDARDADTAAAAGDAGAAELAREAAQRLRLQAQAPALGPTAYPDDWQLGDRVTLDLPDLALRLDRRVEEIRLRADAGEPIAVDAAFGALSPDAAQTLRRLDQRTTPARFQ